MSVEYAGEIPETIYADAVRLRQAVINLVDNAVKFTERGQVRIRVAFLPAWRDGQPAVSLECSTRGSASAPTIPKLFQPFTQADSRTSRKFGGSGLGLTIARHLAELHGGELTVRSEPGRGSVFTLTVPTGKLAGTRIVGSPAEAIAEPVEETSPASHTRLQGVRVLLAEDGLDNQQLIELILRKAGAIVVIAENGRIAVEKTNGSPFDVILMDINMPVMDGYEATRLLRSQGYDRPILALTANAMPKDVARSAPPAATTIVKQAH